MKTISKFKFENLGFGLGLRYPHYDDVLEGKARAKWFEVISENFMGFSNSTLGCPALKKLEKIREQYPIVLHGVSMSIGGSDPLNDDYLKKLKELTRIIEPAWISDHLCWTGVHGHNLHDLLPLPYTKETIKHVVSRIKEAQEILERTLVIENVSSYVEFEESTMSEWEFLSTIVKEANCGLLCDVNNIYVSAHNHNFDPIKYLEALPADHIVQYHLAGPSQKQNLLIDTHDSPVMPEVWDLYEAALDKIGFRNTMIEWDANIPSFERLEQELDLARNRVDKIINKKTRSDFRETRAP